MAHCINIVKSHHDPRSFVTNLTLVRCSDKRTIYTGGVDEWLLVVLVAG